MMRKKVVFTRNPGRASFFFEGYSQNPIFKQYSCTGYLVLVFRETVPTVIYYGKLVPFLT